MGSYLPREEKNDLSYKHEDLNLIHRTHVKIPSVIGHSCNPSTGEAEAGGSLHALATQSNLIGDFGTMRNSVSKDKVEPPRGLSG